MNAPQRKANKLVTENLKDLADSIEGMDDEGKVITKARKLAMLLWDYAIGASRVDVKTGKTERIQPAPWAITLVLDRLEGRVPQATEDISNKPTAGDRVSQLTKDRVNQLAESVNKSGKPSRKDKKGTTGA